MRIKTAYSYDSEGRPEIDLSAMANVVRCYWCARMVRCAEKGELEGAKNEMCALIDMAETITCYGKTEKELGFAKVLLQNARECLRAILPKIKGDEVYSLCLLETIRISLDLIRVARPPKERAALAEMLHEIDMLRKEWQNEIEDFLREEKMKALCEKIKAVDQYDEKGQGVEQMRALVKDLKKGCEAGKANGCPICAQLLAVADNLVRKSVWVLGGDGWAYDIGYGGLDHVLASGKNIKILVMDTEVYSNTGGQASKATPTGAIAKFAASGKVQAKKNLGLMQMQYKNVYVAYVSMGTNPAATVKAFNEAENYNGPAIIIAYAHCIEQGLLTKTGPAHQKAAVESVHFPLWTYNPTTGKVKLDSADKSDTVSFAANAVSKELGENRFKQLVKKIGQDKAMEMLKGAEQGFKDNYALLKKLSEM